MAELTLSPNSTSIFATVSGLGDYSADRVLQFFLDTVDSTPKFEQIIPVHQVRSVYNATIKDLRTNGTYTVIARVLNYSTRAVLETYTEKAICGGTDKNPSFWITDITTNSATVNLYRGLTPTNYYRLYVYDTVDEEAIFTEWLKPDSYPKQLAGLSSGTLYKINIGYGNIYKGGVTWIGTQTFTTIAEFDTRHSDEGTFFMPSSELPRNILRENAGSLKTSAFNAEYTRVTVTTKDTENNSDIAYSVGNDDGLELELSCPWIGANEFEAIKIATYVLSAVGTYKYQPFSASETLIDPAAELGDLISFDNVTSELINLDINYDNLFNADISAPTSNETEHEFSQGATSKDSTKRYVDGVRAALEVEIDKITALVENTEGRFQKLQVTLDGVIIQNEQGQTIINGSHIQTGSIVFNQIDGMNTWKGTVDTGFINADLRMDGLDGDIDSANGRIDAANGRIDAANTRMNGIDSDINSLSSRIGRITSYSWSKVYQDLIDNGGMTSNGGVTMIDGAKIYSPEIYAGKLSTSTPTGGIQLSSNGLAFTLNKISGSSVISDNLISLTTERGFYSGTNYQLPSVLLGQGTGSSSNPSGSLKKYINGIWIGEWFRDESASFDPYNAGSNIGIFINFSNDGLVLTSKMYGPNLPSVSGAKTGQLFFKKVSS